MMQRAFARQLAKQALEQGEPLDWFESLYARSRGDPATIPWADLQVNSNLSAWLERTTPGTVRGAALVVGCGLGDDAEALASRGLTVTAFDISSTCIDWCRRRYAASAVNYQVANLLDAPFQWSRQFDFVLEVYTLQVLPSPLRAIAMDRLAGFVRPGGRLLLISRGRDLLDLPGEMPWPLTRAEFRPLDVALELVRFEDFLDAEKPPVRRFRAEYLRPAPEIESTMKSDRANH